MPSFTHTLPVAAAPAALWALVRDAQRVAALFPYMAVEEFSSPAPDCALFWRRLTIPAMAELRWREQTETVGGRELRFRAVEGDLTTYVGSWQVAADGVEATLTLALEYDIPRHLTPRVPAPLVSYVVGEFFKKICERVKEAAEEERA